MTTENIPDFIQSLLENYSFDQLSKNDKKRVLLELTEAEYNMRHETVFAATALFSEADIHEPKALIVEQKKSILLAPIPLYQMLVSIAALFLLMLLVFPIQKITAGQPSIEYITLRDTIRTEVICYDTIEKVVEKPVFKDKLVYVSQQEKTSLAEEGPRLLNVPRSNQELSFTEASFRNTGVSMKDDTMLVDLPKIY